MPDSPRPLTSYDLKLLELTLLRISGKINPAEVFAGYLLAHVGRYVDGQQSADDLARQVLKIVDDINARSDDDRNVPDNLSDIDFGPDRH